MVLIDHITQSRLHDGRRAVRILAVAAALGAVLLVVAGAAFDKPPVTDELNAAFAVAWVFEAVLILAALVLRVRLARHERRAWASAPKARPPRPKRHTKTVAPTAPSSGRLFPGPPVWAELRIIALGVLYVAGGLWLAAGVAATLDPNHDAAHRATSVALLVVSTAVIASLAWALHRAGRKWQAST